MNDKSSRQRRQFSFLSKREKQFAANSIAIEKRWKIIKILAEGSFGYVYVASDMQREYESVICKINDDPKMNEHESHVLILLN